LVGLKQGRYSQNTTNFYYLMIVTKLATTYFGPPNGHHQVAHFSFKSLYNMQIDCV